MTEENWTLGRHLNSSLRVLKTELEAAFSTNNVGLSTTQFIVLKIISCTDNITLKDISELLMQDKSGVLRLIDSLETNNLLSHVPDKNDKRKKLLVVTSTGQQKIEAANSLVQEIDKSLLKGCTEQEKETFFKVLSLIRENGNHQEENNC